VKTDVQPDEAAIYLDGKLIGTADDFDGYPDTLYLGSGRYHLEFRLDGYENYSTEVDASPGRFFKIDHRLTKIPGAKHYGTYEPAHPEGGIVRYFEKQRQNEPGSSGESWQDRPSGARQDPRGGRQEMYMDQDQSGPGDEDRGAPPNIRDQSVTSEPVPPESSQMPAPPEGRMVFDISPPDAAVYIDDHFAGSARELNGLPEGLAVSPGEHRIVATCPGYREATTRVQVTGTRIGRAAISLKQ